jgi:hypothetical protein
MIRLLLSSKETANRDRTPVDSMRHPPRRKEATIDPTRRGGGTGRSVGSRQTSAWGKSLPGRSNCHKAHHGDVENFTIEYTCAMHHKDNLEPPTRRDDILSEGYVWRQTNDAKIWAFPSTMSQRSQLGEGSSSSGRWIRIHPAEYSPTIGSWAQVPCQKNSWLRILSVSCGDLQSYPH